MVNDFIYDLEVILNGIYSNEANVTINHIEEPIVIEEPEEVDEVVDEEVVEDEVDEVVDEDEEEIIEADRRNYTWLIILGVVIVIGLGVFGYFYYTKKKPKSSDSKK